VRTLADFQRDLRRVFVDDHDYKTLVIDSLDQLEPLIWQTVSSAAGKDAIGDIGFGKGYEAAVADWRKILFVCDKIRTERRMNVILIGHAKVDRFEDPQNDAYDRYSLQLHKKAAAEVTHWTDELLFANYTSNVRKLEDGRRAIGVGSGKRSIYTQERPAFLAKSRVRIPAEIPMPDPEKSDVSGWDIYSSYFTAQEGAAAAAVASTDSTDPASGEPAGQAAPSITSEADPLGDILDGMGFVEHNIDAFDLADLKEAANDLKDKMTAEDRNDLRIAFKANDTARARLVLKRVMANTGGTN